MFKHFQKGSIRQVKVPPKGGRIEKIQELSKATLGVGDFKQAVKLPSDVDINEWFASHVIDFYNGLVTLCSSINDKCTEESCPEMTAGTLKYAWKDKDKYKKATMLPAPEYINECFNWIEMLLDDEKVFPSDPKVPFPKEFRATVSKMFCRLFRIYAHLYYNHLKDIEVAGAEPHLNTSFKHFVTFSKEFDLIPKEQYEPLKTAISKFA